MACVLARRLDPIFLRRAFMAAAVAWAVTLLAAPYAAGFLTTAPGRVVAALPYAVGSVICHQRPERSFALWGQPLPVCARCTGLYAGACLAVAAALARRLVVDRARMVLGLAAIPTLLTFAYEWSTGDAPSNIVRAVAALPLGAAIASVILTAADDRVN